MKINLEFGDFVEQPFDEKWFFEILEKTFNAVKIDNLKNKTITISLAIVDEEEIRKLNFSLRKNNSVTDVLSVGEYSDEKDIKKETEKYLFLGEIILCYKFIQETAKLNETKIEYEIGLVFSHGVLHLLGYQHGEEMFAIQENVCDFLN